MRTKTVVLIALLAVGMAAASDAAEPSLGSRTVEEFIALAAAGNENNTLLGLLQLARETERLDVVLRQTAVAAEQDRTDQQVTASSSTPGSVAKAEKPGIPELLAIAIERGAIAQSKDGTNVTLSTTPYMLLTGLGSGDTPDNWEKLRWARRVALSSTFSSDEVTQGDFSTFLSGELKLILGGSRSGRDVALLTAIPDRALPGLQGLLPCNKFRETTAGTAVDAQITAFDEALEQNPAANNADIETRLAAAIDPSRVSFDEQSARLFEACIVRILALANGIEEDTKTVRELTDAYLAKNLQNQLSAAFLYHRDPAKSDYTTVKVLYGRDITSMKAYLNGEISFNQRGQSLADGKALDRVRGFSIEGSLNSGKMASGRADLAVSFKWYDASDDNTDSVASGQALLNFHINDTMKLPISITYANRTLTEANTRKGLQFEVGIAALLDTVFGSLKR